MSKRVCGRRPTPSTPDCTSVTRSVLLLLLLQLSIQLLCQPFVIFSLLISLFAPYLIYCLFLIIPCIPTWLRSSFLLTYSSSFLNSYRLSFVCNFLESSSVLFFHTFSVNVSFPPSINTPILPSIHHPCYILSSFLPFFLSFFLSSFLPSFLPLRVRCVCLNRTISLLIDCIVVMTMTISVALLLSPWWDWQCHR